MNYIKELNAFSRKLLLNSLPLSAIVLWHTLMAVNNMVRWKPIFNAPVLTLKQLSGLSEKRIEEARLYLIEEGFIRCYPNPKEKGFLYEMVSLVDTETECESDTNKDTTVDPSVNPSESQQWNILKHKQKEKKEEEEEGVGEGKAIKHSEQKHASARSFLKLPDAQMGNLIAGEVCLKPENEDKESEWSLNSESIEERSQCEYRNILKHKYKLNEKREEEEEGVGVGNTIKHQKQKHVTIPSLPKQAANQACKETGGEVCLERGQVRSGEVAGKNNVVSFKPPP